MITILLTLFTIFFIGYSVFLYRGIKAKDNLNALRGKLTLGIMVLFLLFVLSLSLIYANLSSEGYGFKTSYHAIINPETKSVMVGTDKNCDIQIFNRFSESEHIVFDFNKEPIVEIISKERSAIINNKLISLKEKKLVTELKVKDGDIIRLGYSDYKLHFTDKEVRLDNIFFRPSIVNLFNIYSTTTIPNLTNRATGETVSVWWIFLITIAIVLGIISSILFLINSITEKFSMIGDNRYILYPILYFSFFLTFLLFASIINFTVLQYQQFSVYNKGALYTVLLVYGLMLFNIFLARLGYNKNRKSTLIALWTIALIIGLIWLNSGYIYSSDIYDLFLISINRSVVITSLDLSFIFLIFGFGFGRFVKKILDEKENLFLREEVNIKLVKRVLKWIIIISFVGSFFSFGFNEGAGIVLIETIKLFIFFLFTVVLLDGFQKRENKAGFIFYTIVAMIPLLVAVVFGLKDMGSIIQIFFAILIISSFFFNRLKKVNIINKITLYVLSMLLLIGIYWVFDYIHDNIRFDMWISPFEQSLEVKNKFYMYYYEQIARGLYLIKEASLFPNDFINQRFTPLSNLHTDFIFAIFVNIFGMLGFVAIITAFLITIFSFNDSIYLFQNSKRDIYRFIYGINVIFVAYLFSYIIVNMLSVLQIIPLTDVPFPILTYGRGVLILFFVLYIFVGVVNYLYLDFVSRSFRSKI